MAELEQPIIIKKVYKNEGGHHGGAWKVAYADFVTAMMAFFLLLWLLNAAEEETLEGLADYFSPTIGLAGLEGIGVEGGLTDAPDGKQRDNLTPPGLVAAQPAQGVKPGEPVKESFAISEESEQMLFDQAGNTMSQLMYEDPTLDELNENIQMTQTAEGLKIQIMDTEKEPMFHAGKPYLTKAGKRLLAATGQVIQTMPNFISITGHTDATPYTRRVNYSNWELSADRANAARRFLIEEGMVEERVAKVLGRADKELLMPEEPRNPKNRRIEIILLKGQHISTPLLDRPSGEGMNPFNRPPAQSLIDRERKENAAKSKDTLQSKEKPAEDSNFKPYTVIPDTPIQKESVEQEPLMNFVPY